MSTTRQEEYKQLIEELRHRYKQKYGSALDDEILYIIVRINEMQVDLKRDIRSISQISFSRPVAYFWFGLGKTISFLIAGIGLCLMSFVIYLNISFNEYKEVKKGKSWYLLLKNYKGRDTLINSPIQ